MKSVTFVLLLITSVLARQGFGPTEQEWGYVTVREGAHIFWWLHQTTARVDDFTTVPLVIWLQGGPGDSSTGYGNFAELGPLDADLNPRPNSWTNNFNVLFVDSPVGAGFSYTENDDLLSHTTEEIAVDFLVFLQEFYDAVPALKDTPLYIFSEAYGGRIAVEVALAVDRAVKNGTLNDNLKAVALGDSWISPADSVSNWGPYLLNAGVVDQNGYEHIQSAAQLTVDAIKAANYRNATYLLNEFQDITTNYTENVNFLNILTRIEVPPTPQKRLPRFGVTDLLDDKIAEIMNTQVADALGLNSTWGRQADKIYDALYEDITYPITDSVELLLNTTDIKVTVYSGQLDLVVNIPGTAAWVDKLKFDGAEEWNNALRIPVIENSVVEGYQKGVEQLQLFWVDRAGHRVVIDNPSATRYILRSVTGV